MELLHQMQDHGWHLLPTGLDRLLENAMENTDVKKAIKLALDFDLRDIGGGALGAISTRGNKVESIDGNIVVQILKIRNISAPRANEDSKVAPRLLKLTLTDGQTQCSALEGEHLPSISLDTPPGTKIFLKNGPIKLSQGLLILNNENISVLGGKVPALLEKWELSRTMAKYAKGGRIQLSASGPPPWIQFGQKIQQSLPNDKNFKSLQAKEKDESKENAEFTALRNDAIAEATKSGTKKTFGGGAKQMVDANVQKIMDKGFTEAQAIQALKVCRNNVQRALSNLQRNEERRQVQNDIRTGKTESTMKVGKRGLSGKRDTESEALSKPSTKVSLFDFLEDILPESDALDKKNANKETNAFSIKENKSSIENLSNVSPHVGYSESASNRSYGNFSNQHQTSSTANSNNASKSYNQQRFENNISSSFANRNSQINSNRNYSQQPSQPHQLNLHHSAGYKQNADYNNGRGRGSGNLTSSDRSNDMHIRNRQESKYNQNNASTNSHQNQQHPHYRNDHGMHNVGGTAKHSNKHNPSLISSSLPATNYNSGQAENHSVQNNAAEDTRKQPAQFQTQSQPNQQLLPYHTASKVGYNTSNNGPANHHASINNNYGQLQPNNSNTSNNNYLSGGSAGNAKVQKGTRYVNEDSQKYSGSTQNAVTAQGRKMNPKLQNSLPVQSPAVISGGQHPFISTTKQPNTTTMCNNRINQLTDATNNMQISNKPYGNGNSTQITNAPNQQQGRPAMPPSMHPAASNAQVIPKNYIQLPNGFNYNPYQIVGFQNKQTNEFALNVLKSQQFEALQPAQLSAAPSGGTQAQAGPSQGVVIPAATAVIANQQSGSTGVPVHTPGVLPSWKVGDRCLAKYWEDGGFYNAEITGISENTFVVCFLEYGNYEEVLKTDCIPLTQHGTSAPAPLQHGPLPTIGFHPSAAAQLPGASIIPPTPPNNIYASQGGDNQSVQHFRGYKPQTGQYSHPPPSHQLQQQQRPSKIREQRLMYVPPAQRK